MYSKNCNSSVGAGVVSTLSQSESKTLHSQSEPHITKHSWLGRIFKTHSFLLSRPFRIHTAGEPPPSAVSIPTYRAVAWQVQLFLEQSRAEQRGVQDTENPAGETEVNLAMSIWRLSRRTRTKMWPVVFIVSIQLPERWFPDSFKCFCFLSEVYNFHFFLYKS